MAVSSSEDKGFTTVFGPAGRFITKLQIEPPPDAELLTRIGNHYYLEVEEENDDGRTQMLAPIEDDTETHPNAASSSAVAQVPDPPVVPVLNPLEDEWYVMYDKAVAESANLNVSIWTRTGSEAFAKRIHASSAA